MNLISMENLSKSYSEKILFHNISLGINEGDKIGVIGINGTGKSTLLKVISGVESYDEGNIIKNNKVHIEYLEQNPEFDENSTVLEEVFNGNSPIMVTLREYESALDMAKENPENIDIQNRIISLSSKIDALNAWNIESTAKTILNKLGITKLNSKINTLSGGQKKRVALARTLITPSELLILDEPTNHMDNETIAWLEEFLNHRKGALLMITHDRYFLDRVSNKIIELDHGNLYCYEGNFSVFLEKKIEREALEASMEDKRQNLLRYELAWIKRGAKARTTKQKARIQRFEDLSSQDAPVKSSDVNISTAHSRLGKKIIELENITKNFKDKKIIEDFSYIMVKEDRIGIIGENGIGKSTLMNLISGNSTLDNGSIEIGETVKIGYFSQSNYDLKENLRVIEYIKETAEFVETSDGEKISASQMLERFLFTPEAQWTPINKLSGGEKRRLYLLKVLMEAPNVLLLDEPTNDLDISTLQILEEYIENFNGPIMVVSHDRYFLDKIANKIFSFEGNGEILEHTGNYSDFINFKKNLSTENTENLETKKKTVDKPMDKNLEKTNKTLKFSYKEQREYEEIESVIASIEQNLESIQSDIANNSTNYSKLQELLQLESETEELLNEKMERWEYLSEIAEKIELSKKN
ncbi:ABC-F family ATP-binding cassette domain-containing protein [Hathewaya massiliensis]|uniref:ABC-F family ATP-binding cassette domain-containing protein n=1 Tax=Hathewaya massiliensis TaxID=1964382 RepID=UPI00115B8E9F|nr:ABC-F family ATP-binding cassette domain-containing protein [Hathewaya massiliensis]